MKTNETNLAMNKNYSKELDTNRCKVFTLKSKWLSES